MKWLKYIGIGVGVLLVIVAVIGAGLMLSPGEVAVAPGEATSEQANDAGDSKSGEQETTTDEATPIEVATGEATIAKVRVVLNGEEDTRQDFEAIEQAAKELRGEHYDVKVFDHKANNSDHWVTSLRSIAASDAEFLVAGTGQLSPWIVETAQANPSKYWVTWDAGIELPNVTDIRFDNQRGAWLAGRVAGLATTNTEYFPRSANPENRIIGVVAAFPGADSDAYINGFRDGAKSVHPDMDVRVIYTNSMEDSTQANNATNQLYTDGARVVFSLLGKSNIGVLASARVHNGQVITVGTDETKKPREPVLATLVRPVHRELVELITSNNPQNQRVVDIGVGQDDVYVEVRSDVDPKVSQAVDDQIEAWEKEEEKK